MIGEGNGALPLPMSGTLPPDLQGTLFRVGPAWPWGADGGAGLPVDGGAVAGDNDGGPDSGGPDGAAGAAGVAGALHAMEIRDGRAVWYQRQESDADAGVFWHAGSLLALPETGIPLQYSRFLEPEEFGGGLTVPIASHVHRLAVDGGRVLFGVEGGGGGEARARATTRATAFSCASVSGTRRERCGRPNRWNWSGRPGSTTSVSRRGMWCSLSRRQRVCRRGTAVPMPCRSGGCPVPKGGSAWCREVVMGPLPVNRWVPPPCSGSDSTLAW